MLPSDQKLPLDDDDIDLIALWRVVWTYKYIIASITILFGLLAVFLALSTAPIYRAEVVVTEVRNDAGSSGAIASQFGGHASLAGINLGGGGGGRDARAVLASRSLVEDFVKRNNLISELFPGAKTPPTLWLAVRKFQEEVLSIREDKRVGTTHVTISWKDPAKSASWANGVVSLADDLIRARALEDSTRSIAYLNKQITTTNVVELQRVMYNLIESETKTLMLANARAEYAFNVVDPAVTPEIRVSPKRTMMVMIGSMLGFFVGMVVAFILNKMASRQISRPLSKTTT